MPLWERIGWQTLALREPWGIVWCFWSSWQLEVLLHCFSPMGHCPLHSCGTGVSPTCSCVGSEVQVPASLLWERGCHGNPSFSFLTTFCTAILRGTCSGREWVISLETRKGRRKTFGQNEVVAAPSVSPTAHRSHSGAILASRHRLCAEPPEL